MTTVTFVPSLKPPDPGSMSLGLEPDNIAQVDPYIGTRKVILSPFAFAGMLWTGIKSCLPSMTQGKKWNVCINVIIVSWIKYLMSNFTYSIL